MREPLFTSSYDYAIDTTKAAEPARADFFRPPPTQTCSLPVVETDQILVLFSTYEGQAMSSAAVSDIGVETRATDVDIQPGDKPLYIVLASHRAMIWRFKGATDRVASLVLMSDAKAIDGQPAVGAVGIGTDRIASLPLSACMQEFSDPGSRAAALAVDEMTQLTGRRPDVLGATYTFAAIRLPSAMAVRVQDDFAPTPKGFDHAVWRSARRYSPAGVFQISPQDVHGAEPAQAYDILPGQAGIAQLTGAGALKLTSDGYRIEKPVAHYPAELSGAEAVNFILPSGMSEPAGDPGQSCVIDETPQRPAPGRRCL
jgi:hypothetical protein